jgi:hypothetical protein
MLRARNAFANSCSLFYQHICGPSQILGKSGVAAPEIRHVVRGGRGSPLTRVAVRIVNARNETSALHIHVALVLSRRDFTNAPAIVSFFLLPYDVASSTKDE